MDVKEKYDTLLKQLFFALHGIIDPFINIGFRLTPLPIFFLYVPVTISQASQRERERRHFFYFMMPYHKELIPFDILN